MRFALLLVGLLALTGCAGVSVWAPEEQVQKVRYRHDGPTGFSLVTVKNVGGNENGAHTALIVNGSERVIFDPAGSFEHPDLPERNDVVFGANPAVVDYFLDYHTREDFFTIVQTVELSPAVAEDLLNRVKNFGAVPPALCSRSTSFLLSQTPGFESLAVSMFPNKTHANFAAFPNVHTVEFRDGPNSGKGSKFFRWVGQEPRYNIE